MCQRQVDVVAAEEDVVADREAGQRQATLLLAHCDEREVAGAAADVDDEDDVARTHVSAPFVAGGLDPGVERRLWFLEERELRKARLRRRLHREIAGGG